MPVPVRSSATFSWCYAFIPLVLSNPSLDIVDKAEQAVPADAGESAAVGVGTPPDEDGFADDVVFGHEAPVAGVEGVVAVVALHPIVVHLEGVLRGLLVVDEDLAVADLQLVALVGTDGALIDGQVLQRQVDGLALGRYPDRTIVVARPMHVTIERIDVQFGSICISISGRFLKASAVRLVMGM